MMLKIREKAEVMTKLLAINETEHQELRDAAMTNDEFWNAPGDLKETFKKFKTEVKAHYHQKQLRRCCYCSCELAKNQSTWDAEHIFNKREHPEFMFELNNLAASCRPCNGSKGIKSPLKHPLNKPQSIPNNSEVYAIVHPHLDEWNDFLEFDQYGRVCAKPGQEKGKYTIKVCGIYAINAARLSDHFSVKANKEAESALFKFFTLKRNADRTRYLNILKQLAVDYNLKEAKAIVDRLKEELSDPTSTAPPFNTDD